MIAQCKTVKISNYKEKTDSSERSGLENRLAVPLRAVDANPLIVVRGLVVVLLLGRVRLGELPGGLDFGEATAGEDLATPVVGDGRLAIFCGLRRDYGTSLLGKRSSGVDSQQRDALEAHIGKSMSINEMKRG